MHNYSKYTVRIVSDEVNTNELCAAAGQLL